MPDEHSKEDSDDLLPKHVTLLNSLESIYDSLKLSGNVGSPLFKEQHLKSAMRNLQKLSEYIEKNKCNFIIFENQ